MTYSPSSCDERIEMPEVGLGSISFRGFGLWLGVVFALAGVLWLAALFAPWRTVGWAALGGAGFTDCEVAETRRA